MAIDILNTTDEVRAQIRAALKIPEHGGGGTDSGQWLATFTPQDFGAAADGATDDSGAIQEAIDAAEEVGGRVHLSGAYRVDHDLTLGLGNFPCIVSGGEGRALLLAGSASAQILIAHEGTTLKNVTLEEWVHPVALVVSEDYTLGPVHILGCTFRSCTQHERNLGLIGLFNGVSTYRAFGIEELRIQRCLFERNDGTLIHVRSHAIRSAVVTENVLRKNKKTNIFVGGTDNQLNGIMLGDGEPPFTDGAGARNVVVAYNQLLDNFSHLGAEGGNVIGISVNGTNVIVHGNILDGWGEPLGSEQYHMDVVGVSTRSEFATITDNVFSHVNGADDDGVLSIKTGGRWAINIDGNVFRRCTPTAIQLNTSYATISNNQFYEIDAPAFCLTLRYGGGNQVVNNVFVNCAHVEDRSEKGNTFSGNRFVNTELRLRTPQLGEADPEDVTRIVNNSWAMETSVPCVRFWGRRLIEIRGNTFYVSGAGSAATILHQDNNGGGDELVITGNTFRYGENGEAYLVLTNGVESVAITNNLIQILRSARFKRGAINNMYDAVVTGNTVDYHRTASSSDSILVVNPDTAGPLGLLQVKDNTIRCHDGAWPQALLALHGVITRVIATGNTGLVMLYLLQVNGTVDVADLFDNYFPDGALLEDKGTVGDTNERDNTTN